MDAPAASFSELGLPERLVATLTHYELTVPFPIQAATIPDAMAGRDVLGKARTGSGKTLAFGLPILARLADLPKPGPHQVHALVLVPTRELAMQVGDALEPYAHATQLTYRLVAGGLSMSKQIMAVERGVHLVVATPGRLADLVRRGHIDLSHTSITVLDEADHMAEMGFGEEIAEILDKTPNDAQRLLFSATLDGVVDDLVRRYMHNPVMHDVTDGSAMPTQRHVMISIPPHEKYQMATRMAARDGRTMCFVRTKLAADRIAADMRAHGVLAVALHGDRSQAERNFVMVEFRAGRLPVLVATDVAARGIHVDAVDLVIQIDPPADYRDYTHRSGRTGRAGADGLAVMLVLPHQRNAALRVLDAAGIDAEDAAFRTIDAAALAKIDALTGARQPSGVPVTEPLPVMRPDRRGGRERPAGDSRGGRERPGRDRPTRGRQAPPARDDAAFAAKRDHLTAKERELADRERALVAREQQLAQQSAASARSERPERFERTERTERFERTERTERTERPERSAPPARADRSERPASAAPQSRVGWARSDDSRSGAYRGNRDDSRGAGSRGAGYQGNRPDARGGDAPRSGYQGNRPDARGGDAPRTGWAPRSDAPRSGYQGNRPDSRGSDAPRSSGYQGNRPDSRGSDAPRTGWAPRSDAPRTSGYQGNRPDSRGSDAPRSGWSPRSDAPRSSGYQGNRPDSRGSDAPRSGWAPRSDAPRSSGYQGNRPDSRGGDAPRSSGYQGNHSDSRGSDAPRTGWAPRSDAPRSSGYQGNRPDSRGSDAPRTGWAPRSDAPRGDDRNRSPRVDGVRSQGGDRSAPERGTGDARRNDWQGANATERPAHKSKTSGRQPPGSRRGKARPKKKD